MMKHKYINEMKLSQLTQEVTEHEEEVWDNTSRNEGSTT
jgi:hypothetical protein